MEQNTPRWPTEGRWWEGGKFIRPSELFKPARLETVADRRTRTTGGRRSRTRTTRKRGRYASFRPTPGDASDLAFDATLRAAAPYQQQRRQRKPSGPPTGPAFHVRPTDYQKKIRVRRAANLIIFAVDASWSMAVSERMEATKGAVLSLLTDAYQRRDRVGLVVFQKDRATLVLPPTNSVELAQKCLANLPVGGKTPLAAGLWLAYQTIMQEWRRHPELMPLLVILTDGAGNVSMGDQPPQVEAYMIAERIREAKIKSIVINMESADYDKGLAHALAEHLGGECHNLAALQTPHLLATVRTQLRN
ncbi:MAG TPA: VWA domain-containing protein [Chloroflexi bacterium]|nr:VWA domain-containing protein [Chloroflexota bacterium]